MAAKSRKGAVKLGLGVTICDEKHNVLFQIKGLLQDDYMTFMDAHIWPGRSLYPRQAKTANKESCVICFNDGIDFDLMFSVDVCGHRFCANCVKQHIEVKLLDRKIPNCLQHRCESQLSIDRYGKLLTLKLSLIWKQRIKEEAIPLTERVYCPYQSCSYLMSKTELCSSLALESGLRKCFRCDGYFCLHCKVPWHNTLSCSDYKKLHPNPQKDDDAKLRSLASIKGWRQCGKCKHMVERSSGCNCIFCRCGNTFCYNCGSKWTWNHFICDEVEVEIEGDDVEDDEEYSNMFISSTGVVIMSCLFFIFDYSVSAFAQKDYSVSAQMAMTEVQSKGAQDFSDFLFAFL